MTKSFRKWLALSFLLTVSLPVLAETPSTARTEPHPKITVRIYDMAGMNSKTLQGAKKVATRVLQKAGVDINWLSCTWTGTAGNPVCGKPVRSNEIALRILRRSKTVRHSTGHITGGLAVSLTEQGGSGFISLFYDRVEELAEIVKCSRSLVLGHMTAHEIGHLLLPEVGHSRRGIMRARLNEKDWEQAGQGGLLFTRRQAKSILAGVLARARQQDAAQIGS